MLSACHIHAMANLQVKNIPESLHHRLRKYAKKRNCTLGDVVLTAIEHELSRGEFKDKLAKRSTIALGVRASELLGEERASRDQELSG